MPSARGEVTDLVLELQTPPPPLVIKGGGACCWSCCLVVELAAPAAAPAVGAIGPDDELVDELLMFNFLPKDTDEETIIFLKFDVNDSDETNELTNDD